MDTFTVNDRTYRLPEQPVVVICVDGCEEAYLDVALAQDRMPSLARILEMGWRGSARGALPSFTNVNNAAIVTGMPPSVTGLSGNFFLNQDTGEEVMMNSAAFISVYCWNIYIVFFFLYISFSNMPILYTHVVKNYILGIYIRDLLIY